MGYTTDFHGEFALDKPLTPAHKAYLEAFAETRRMKRDAAKTATLPDPVREAVGLPVGVDGEFFVGSGEDFGQDRTPDVVDYNGPPSTQPGLWCQWAPTDDDAEIAWDGSEKFYYYVQWLEYLIEKLLEPWGYVLNGEVTWQGEEDEDRGMICVVDNDVSTKIGKIVYE